MYLYTFHYNGSFVYNAYFHIFYSINQNYNSRSFNQLFINKSRINLDNVMLKKLNTCVVFIDTIIIQVIQI